MLKRLVVSSVMAATAIFALSGCGNEDTTSCRFDVQEALDKGDFSYAISLLDGECKVAYTPEELNYNLAFAYLGESGFGVSDVLKMVIDAGDKGGDAYVDFVDEVSRASNRNSIVSLSKAKDYFVKAAGEDKTVDGLKFECENSVEKSKRMGDICVYLGFSQSVIAASTVNYLTKNVKATLDAIENENIATPLDMKASLDAMAWASGQTDLIGDSDIEANDVTIKGKKYKHVKVELEGKTFYRLADSKAPSETSSIIVTDGYCNAEGNVNVCEGIENEDGSINTAHSSAEKCYACPVFFEDEALRMNEVLINALNDSKDIVKATVEDEDIRESIDEFMEEITGDPTKDVTLKDIIEYYK